MARTGSFIKAALVIGCGAALGYLVYKKREWIQDTLHGIFSDPSEDFDSTVMDFEPSAPAPDENHIVIDRTAGAERPEKETEVPVEDAAEAAPAEEAPAEDAPPTFDGDAGDHEA